MSASLLLYFLALSLIYPLAKFKNTRPNALLNLVVPFSAGVSAVCTYIVCLLFKSLSVINPEATTGTVALKSLGEDLPSADNTSTYSGIPKDVANPIGVTSLFANCSFLQTLYSATSASIVVLGVPSLNKLGRFSAVGIVWKMALSNDGLFNGLPLSPTGLPFLSVITTAITVSALK